MAMEITQRPKPLDPPLAELVGLQFGLSTKKDILNFSVRTKDESVTAVKHLVDPRLGLPSEDEKCATCGGTSNDECTGHFSHVKLTQAIFHPNHMRLLQRTLQKICLGCGVPLVKKKKMEVVSSEEAVKRRKRSRGFDMETPGSERVQPEILEAEQAPTGSGVIVLSSDDEECPIPRDILQVVGKQGRRHVSATEEATAVEALETSQRCSLNSYLHGNGTSKRKSAYSQAHMGIPAGVDVLYSDYRKCRHCSSSDPDYPPITVKIQTVKGKRKDDEAQILMMEIDNDQDKVVAPDFWAFVDGAYDEDMEPPRNKILLPFQALNVLKKIPTAFISKIGMNKSVARPEALIMECVPVPPNCTRTCDYKYVNNTTAVRFGVDRVTRTLQTLVNEIVRIENTRSKVGKPTRNAVRDESRLLQILTAGYLREKGAPKAVPGKDPVKKDRQGRVTKQDDRRWTKEWLTQNILGKGGSFTARAVITGDPFIGVGEIGVPLEISQTLTIPERVTEWNRKKLQGYVDRTQTLDVAKGPGAERIVRDSEAFKIWSNSTHKVEIGDVVHRHIQDGDYIYANRPPSVHKHSLMALEVKIHSGLVLTINPLICPPYNADFDGDIFHIFVPQSVKALAELQELMTVQQQIVSVQGSHPLLGLTQDTLLAAHLITSSKLLVEKESMHQLCMWASRELPEAAIVKSPKGGPLWTGEQLYGLTLPAEFSFESSDNSILIKHGEILKWHGDPKWLQKAKDTVTGALLAQLGGKALVEYLNCAKGLLHGWLHMEGFSAGLTDFLVTNDLEQRRIMLQSVFNDYFLKAIQESCNSIQILDAQAHTSEAPVDMDIEGNFDRLVINPAGLSNKVKLLEETARTVFRIRANDAEKIVLKFARKGNSLLTMVKSGSKGSMSKLLQQIAGMGLQLYKGKHILPFTRIQHYAISDQPLIDWWDNHGLVRSSLVDGLNASELFSHIIADRTGILRKHVEVIQPGTLFKSLMLFLRDLHVWHDGTVRSRSGKSLVQFCYGGAVGKIRRTPSVQEDGGWTQVSVEEDAEMTEQIWDEDQDKRWDFSRLAGEPVGVLAATALAQPAYELMLDAPNLNGPFKPRPLELVQETVYPREKSELKAVDRCAILRLVKCMCSTPLCLEKRVLHVQACLRRITLKMLAQRSAIEFWNMENFEAAGPNGIELRLGSPWLGHIQLSEVALQQHQLNGEDVVRRLQEKFSGPIKKKTKETLGRIFFCHSDHCMISNGLCVHFSPKLPPKMQNLNNDDMYNNHLLQLMEKTRDIILPALFDSTVKGIDRMESVKVVCEDPSWSSWHHMTSFDRKHPGEELVVEVVVKATKQKMKRNMAWTAVKEACAPIMELIDWNRSMPYSIQEIKHALGVEVAYEMILRRLALVLEKTAPHIPLVHAKLISDMMTFSGDANGFTFSGYQDMIRSANISAPFTEASFQKPIRNLLDAAGKGASDPLESVMTCCVWGKEAPLGTGIDVDILWQPPKDTDGEVATQGEASRDVHSILKDLAGKCIPDKIIPPSPTRSLPDLHVSCGDMETDFQGGFSPRNSPDGTAWDDVGNNDDGWGTATEKKGIDGRIPTENDGGWGDSSPTSKDAGGWDNWANSPQDGKDQGDTDTATAKGDAWGSTVKETQQNGRRDNAAKTSSGWDAIEEADEGGWGTVNTQKSLGGARKNPNEGRELQEGGWEEVRTQKSSDDHRELDVGVWGDDNTANEGCELQEGGWDEVRNLKSSNDHRELDAGGWGDDNTAISSKSTHKQGEAHAVGEWGSATVNNTGGDGWDSIDAEPDQGGWKSSSKGISSVFGETCLNEGHERSWSRGRNNVHNIVGNLEKDWGEALVTTKVRGDTGSGGISTSGISDGGWGAEPAKESGASGWDSMLPSQTQADGLDVNATTNDSSITERTGWGFNDVTSEVDNDLRGSSQRTRDNGNDRGWTPHGRGRGRGSYGRERSHREGLSLSGANTVPIGKRKPFGSKQTCPEWTVTVRIMARLRTSECSLQEEGASAGVMSLTSDWAQDVQNAGENKTWNDSGAGKEESTQGWDELPSSSNAPDRDGRSWNQSEDQESLTLLPTSRPIDIGSEWGATTGTQTNSNKVDGWDSVDTSQTNGTSTNDWAAALIPARQHQDAGIEQTPSADTGSEWGALVTGTQTNGNEADGWDSVDTSEANGTATDDWAAVPIPVPQYQDTGIESLVLQVPTRPARGAGPRQPEQEPENKEIDDIVKCMRRILFNLANEDGAKLSDEDDKAVQNVLQYHPKYTEKVGCGIAYIKVDRSPGFHEVRCFWLVRTDGSETDFSFHKCLKEKVVKEFPSFVDRYDILYGGSNRRPRGPTTNVEQAELQQIEGEGAQV